MKYENLINNCEYFYKASQQQNIKKVKPIFLDPKKKNIDFYSKFLFNAIKSYALLLPSPLAARTIFNNIAKYNQAPAYSSDKPIKDLDAIEAGLQESINKLKAANVDPLKVLKNKGMINVNPSIFDVLFKNIEVLKKAENFNAYQHYALVAPGEANPKDVIELDDIPNREDPGY